MSAVPELPAERASGLASGRASGGALLAALSVANFSIGMGAFVVIGLIVPIAEGFDTSASAAGSLLTVYSIAYAVGSPLGVALTGRLPRRRVLVGALSLFALGALLSALAPSLGWLNAARVLVALGAGCVTPVAASIALASSPAGGEGRALARVFFGLTLAQVLGVPAGGWLGYTFGWQSAFLVVAALSALSASLAWHLVPRALAVPVNTLATLGAALADWRSLVAVLFTATYIAAIYVLYTYLAPLLQADQGYGRDGVTLVLVVFGLGAIAGNLLGGTLSDRIGPSATLVLACLAQALTLPAFSLLPMSPPVLLFLTLAWSTCGWSFMVAQQARIVRQRPERQGVLLALNAAAIYAGAAIGSGVGGAVDRGPRPPGARSRGRRRRAAGARTSLARGRARGARSAHDPAERLRWPWNRGSSTARC